MSSLALTLPYPPSTNHLYATVNGRRVLTQEGRVYKRKVGWLAKQALMKANASPYPKRTLIILTWHVFMPDWRRRDLTNCLKAIEDAITEAQVWHDDSYVVEHHIYKEVVAGQRYVTLEITQKDV